ncbi:MAG: DUF3999 family protein, partial [Desulfocapsaceae bacterium]|nr:DUF3999 family protein [Desulfocapsaceae bacterium]
IKQDGSGLRAGHCVPSLKLGWVAGELLFIGRGNPPFLLAFGSGKLEERPRASDNEKILQPVKNQLEDRMIGQLQRGNMVLLGGEKALRTPQSPKKCPKWLLWSVMILGSGLLALTIRELMREMRKRFRLDNPIKQI